MPQGEVARGGIYAAVGLGAEEIGFAIIVFLPFAVVGAFYIFEGEFPEKKLFYLIFANRDDWNREELVEKFDSIFTAARWL